jgi:hypothetical protein
VEREPVPIPTSSQLVVSTLAVLPSWCIQREREEQQVSWLFITTITFKTYLFALSST